MATMALQQYSFEIDSFWQLDASFEELDFVLENPLSIADWWASVFMQVEVLGGDYYSQDGLQCKLWTKGFLPHTFSFIANVFHDKNEEQVIVKTTGDFGGLGTISRYKRDVGSIVHINWRTRVDSHWLYWLMMMIKPLFVANHKWAMRKGRLGLTAEIERRRLGGSVTRKKQKPVFPHNIIARLQRP